MSFFRKIRMNHPFQFCPFLCQHFSSLFSLRALFGAEGDQGAAVEPQHVRLRAAGAVRPRLPPAQHRRLRRRGGQGRLRREL